MRHPLFQRIVSLLLLAGVTAASLPFGRDAVMRERWHEWVRAVAPEVHHAALLHALTEVLAELHPGAHALARALVLRDDADPAWFGLEDFSPDAVRRLEQQMAAVPTSDPLQPMLVQGYATSAPPLAAPAGLAAAAGAYVPALLRSALLAAAPTAPAVVARLTGTRISPRAP